MALVLCVKIGTPFFVGDTEVMIREIISPTRFIVSVGTIRFEITDEESVEILPQVRVSCGGSCPVGFVKIVLEAPKEIIIARERIYKQRQSAKHQKAILEDVRSIC